MKVNFDGDRVKIGDTKYLRNPGNDPESDPFIEVAFDKWANFLDLVRYGYVANAIGLPKVEMLADGGGIIRSAQIDLVYNKMEWDAFLNGVLDGEFVLAPA